MPKKVDLFTFIRQIQSKRKTVPYDKKIAPAFVLSLFLSMNKKYIKTVNKINKYQYVLPDQAIYDYYMSAIPVVSKNDMYSRFVKKRDGDDEYKTRLEKIRKLYPESSEKECKMILSFLTRREKNADKYQKF